jgi:hypothetical protein
VDARERKHCIQVWHESAEDVKVDEVGSGAQCVHKPAGYAWTQGNCQGVGGADERDSVFQSHFSHVTHGTQVAVRSVGWQAQGQCNATFSLSVAGLLGLLQPLRQRVPDSLSLCLKKVRTDATKCAETVSLLAQLQHLMNFVLIILLRIASTVCE